LSATGEAGQRPKRSKSVVADNKTAGTWVTVAQRASLPNKRSCGGRSRNGWVGSGGYGPEESVDDQPIQQGPVVLVETFAYSASVFVPQVRAQHGAFALLTVRLKFSVLTNSALTGTFPNHQIPACMCRAQHFLFQIHLGHLAMNAVTYDGYMHCASVNNNNLLRIMILKHSMQIQTTHSLRPTSVICQCRVRVNTVTSAVTVTVTESTPYWQPLNKLNWHSLRPPSVICQCRFLTSDCDCDFGSD
jgi:hypothetical protein